MLKLFRLFMIILILTPVLTFAVWVETAASEEFQFNTNRPHITICENLVLNGQNTPEKTSVANDSADSEKENGATPSVLEQRIILEKQTQKKPFIVSLHRQNYFLGATYNSNPNRKLYESVGKEAPKDFEAKFQLSIRMLVWPNLFNGKADLYAAYTQLSFWQIYSFSSPFRETNYEPELFLSFGTNFNVLGLTNRLFLFGAVHQSNGMGGDLSRSWNRIYVEFIAGRGNFVTGLKAWYRIPEDKEDDDNPDIQHYLGYGHIFGAYKYRKNVFSFLFRNNLRFDENKGSIEVGWSYPIINRLRAYVQYFYGYGESLADYNVRTNRIGIGVMINDWI
jgi:phospholipase A1/A2